MSLDIAEAGSPVSPLKCRNIRSAMGKTILSTVALTDIIGVTRIEKGL